MDKVKLGLFDVFAYILPGLFLFVLCLYSFEGHPFCLKLLREAIDGLSVYSLSAVLVVAYVIGFAIQHFAYQSFKIVLERLGGKKYTKGYDVSLSKRGDEIALIRHSSSSSYDSLHTFMAMRSMSYSLFFALCIFSIGLTLLSVWTCSWPREAVFAISLSAILSLFCLINSIRFHRMCQELITATMKALAHP